MKNENKIVALIAATAVVVVVYCNLYANRDPMIRYPNSAGTAQFIITELSGSMVCQTESSTTFRTFYTTYSAHDIYYAFVSAGSSYTTSGWSVWDTSHGVYRMSTDNEAAIYMMVSSQTVNGVSTGKSALIFATEEY